MNKPTKPNITIPESFAANGVKADFDNNKILNGFDRIQPDVLAGDNLNKFIDDTYKGLNYGIAAGDAINLIQEGEVLTVKNGKLVSSKQAGGWTPSLLQLFWSDHELNRMDMLRSDTFSWQSGTTYSQAYNELLAEYKNSASTTKTEGSITFKRTPKGYKIALANQESAVLNKYNTDGIAWYYILDTTNKKFKLPRTKFGFEGLRTSVGDDIEAGLPNITADWNSAQYDGGWSAKGAVYGVKNNSKEQNSGSSGMRAYFDASRSSSIYGNSDTVQPPATQMYLYFYVGNFTKSAEAQTAGLNSELLNGKVDLNFNNMNPSKTAKNTIVSWNMPDYSAGVSVSLPYTATKKCCVYVTLTKNASEYSTAEIYVNGIKITSAFTTANNQWNEAVTVVCYISVGDKITTNSTNATYNSVVFPLKGDK